MLVGSLFRGLSFGLDLSRETGYPHCIATCLHAIALKVWTKPVSALPKNVCMIDSVATSMLLATETLYIRRATGVFDGKLMIGRQRLTQTTMKTIGASACVLAIALSLASVVWAAPAPDDSLKSLSSAIQPAGVSGVLRSKRDAVDVAGAVDI